MRIRTSCSRPDSQLIVGFTLYRVSSASRIHNDIIRAIDEGHVVALALLDLSSAFDTVVEFYLYPTVGTVLIHSVKPELTA